MATTRNPAEQNPAVDPELPQPSTTIPTPPIEQPAPVQPGTINSFPPVINVDLTAPPAVVDPGFRPSESTITTVTAPEPLPEPREAGIAAANEQTGLVTTPAPGTVETFRPNESTITAVNKEPGPDVYEAGGGGGNQGTITRVTYQPQDVPPTEDPAAGATVATATGGN